MGGHGGLNILPQKRWNVYNFENREKVRKDEEAAAAEERRVAREQLQRDGEKRREILRERAKLRRASLIEGGTLRLDGSPPVTPQIEDAAAPALVPRGESDAALASTKDGQLASTEVTRVASGTASDGDDEGGVKEDDRRNTSGGGEVLPPAFGPGDGGGADGSTPPITRVKGRDRIELQMIRQGKRKSKELLVACEGGGGVGGGRKRVKTCSAGEAEKTETLSGSSKWRHSLVSFASAFEEPTRQGDGDGQMQVSLEPEGKGLGEGEQATADTRFSLFPDESTFEAKLGHVTKQEQVVTKLEDAEGAGVLAGASKKARAEFDREMRRNQKEKAGKSAEMAADDEKYRLGYGAKQPWYAAEGTPSLGSKPGLDDPPHEPCAVVGTSWYTNGKPSKDFKPALQGLLSSLSARGRRELQGQSDSKQSSQGSAEKHPEEPNGLSPKVAPELRKRDRKERRAERKSAKAAKLGQSQREKEDCQRRDREKAAGLDQLRRERAEREERERARAVKLIAQKGAAMRGLYGPPPSASAGHGGAPWATGAKSRGYNTSFGYGR